MINTHALSCEHTQTDKYTHTNTHKGLSGVILHRRKMLPSRIIG